MLAQPFAGPIFWTRHFDGSCWSPSVPQTMDDPPAPKDVGRPDGPGRVKHDTESVFLAKQGEWLQLATIMEPGCWVSLETMYLLQLQSIFKFLSLLFSPLVCSMFSAVLSWQKYEEWGNGCKVRGFDGSTAREGLGSEPDVHAAHLAFVPIM